MAILNMTQAARAAGIGRSTLYRHAKKGSLSITTLPDGSPGVDSSELFRVFTLAQPAEPTEVIGMIHKETYDTALSNMRILHLEELLAAERRNNDNLQRALNVIENKQSVGGFFARLFGGQKRS